MVNNYNLTRGKIHLKENTRGTQQEQLHGGEDCGGLLLSDIRPNETSSLLISV